MSNIERLEAIAFIFQERDRYIRIEEGHGNYQWWCEYYNDFGVFEGLKKVGDLAQELEDAYQHQERINMKIYQEYAQLKIQGKPPFR